MSCRRGNENPFHRSTVGSQHQIVPTEIEMLNGQWIQGQKLAVYSACKRCAVQERSLQQTVTKAERHFVRIGNQREEIGSRIHQRQGFGDTLSASLGDEPVMDYGNSHRTQKLRSRLQARTRKGLITLP